MKTSPHLLQPEKAGAKQQTSNMAQNKYIIKMGFVMESASVGTMRPVQRGAQPSEFPQYYCLLLLSPGEAIFSLSVAGVWEALPAHCGLTQV